MEKNYEGDLILLRGLPGSGKTTLANIILQLPSNFNPEILSADDFFEGEDGEYNFDSTKIKEAHNYLQSLTEKKKQENNTTIRNHIPNTQSILFQPSLDPLKNSISDVANVMTNNAPINIQPAIQNIGPRLRWCRAWDGRTA